MARGFKFITLAFLVLFGFSIIKTLKVLAVAETVTSTVGISVQIGEVSPSPSQSPNPGYGGGEVIIPLRGEATMVMEGFTSPGAFLAFLRNGGIIATGLADGFGKFSRSVKTESGNAIFGIWARDSLFLTSQTSNFSLTLPVYTTTTVKDLFLSPTIKLVNVLSYKGLPQKFKGSSFPGADIHFILNNEQKALVKTDVNGDWEYMLKTQNLNEGLYKIKVRGRLPNFGVISPFSEEIVLDLKRAERRGDCNGDQRVNIADFSILLFYWHETNLANSCVDLNFDAMVDIADVSAMMYFWTT